MFKRIVSIFVVFAILLTAFAFTASAADNVANTVSQDGFVYFVTNSNATIWQYVGDAEEITIPTVIDGYTVKEVGSFQEYSNGYEIGTEFIYFSKTLKSIIVPEGIEKIDIYGSKLLNVAIPVSADGNVSIYMSDIETLDVPEGYTVMPFVKWCEKLVYVTLPETLTTIPDQTFWGCTMLNSITIPKSVVNVTANAFRAEDLISDFIFNCYADSTMHKICLKEGFAMNLLDKYSGDANDDYRLDIRDLVLIRKYIAKWSVAQEINLNNADCNGDGIVNLLDLILLRKYFAKWDVKLV